MTKIIVAGCGTDVGKTIVSSILAILLKADYWKPVQCGEEIDCDTTVIKNLLDLAKHSIHPPAYSLKAPLSPHHAARLENVLIDVDTLIPPQTKRALIIESVGGIFVPLTCKDLSIDIFKEWDCKWVVVSKHYVGSINHTLLTLDALQKRDISIAGLVFNGDFNPDSEEAIFARFQLPILGRVFPETEVNIQTIRRYAQQWQPQLHLLIP